MKKKVCVIGSINIDLIVKADSLPKQGETIIGNSFLIKPGGKGANQAIASSKMGVDVYMIGAIGGDEFGEITKKNLIENNINVSGLEKIEHCPTGVANIIISDQDNRIIVVQGANEQISLDMINNNMRKIIESDIILLQLEIPIKIVDRVVEIAHDYGIQVVLNPAPYQKLSNNICRKITYITPNENEFEGLLNSGQYDILKNKMIVTMGDKGVMIQDRKKKSKVNSHKVQVVDTTGAGDTFNGVLVAMLAKGNNLEKAVQIANAAAALSVTKMGAQEGMPTIKELNTFLNRKNGLEVNI